MPNSKCHVPVWWRNWQDGKEIVAHKYKVIQVFKNNKARVSINKLWGMIDLNGKEIITVKYEKIGFFYWTQS